MEPEKRAQLLIDRADGYSCGIGREIQCRESYDALLEIEKMGGKIRDTDDEYVGVMGRDEKTKFMLSPRYQPTNACFRIWGTTFKPALKKECKRLGVQVFDRVMVTSLLNEGGVQGGRIVGATGVNTRTGEFMIFKAKATILSMANVHGDIWYFNTELAGIPGMGSRNNSGDGVAIAWKAGAELTMMEKTSVVRIAAGHKHKWYMGAGDASYENVKLIDDNGKSLSFDSRGIGTWPQWFPEEKKTVPIDRMSRWDIIHEGVLQGEFALPFWGDFPSMPEIERRATWMMMLREESTTRTIVDTFNEAGFDTSKDVLQNYQFIEGGSLPQWRSASSGGLMVDWNLKSNLDGLYVAGMQMFSPGDHSYAAATGRYAGRKAVDSARQTGAPVISREQVDREKERVYAPIKRKDGMDWKELHFGINRTMQYFCSEYKTETLFDSGLQFLKEIEEEYVPKLCALDPHKLMRSLEDLSILNNAQVILHASKARKASSKLLGFERIDYPEVDPPEWAKFLVIKMEDGKVKTELKPLDFYGDIKQNYEAHNKDYTGVYQG
jgi:succinate dehydrogenase/fumarate reductase flavoprotein subunit